MEKIEILESQEEQPVRVVEVKPHEPWIVKDGVKTCPGCGKELHGWAFRQEFDYCPFCGERRSQA